MAAALSNTENESVHQDVPPGPGALSASEDDERWQLVTRIASSTPFRKSPRIRQFLLFVAERALTGRSEEITEYEIGWKVFERGQNYNPSDDSIVRTAARQLRAKVKEYFDSEGVNETWTLEIPKGGYVPVFTRREAEPVRLPISPAPEPAAPPPSPATRRYWRTAAAALGVVSLALAGVAFYLWQQLKEVRPRLAPTIVSTLFADTQQPTRIVVGDFGNALMAFAAGRLFSVEEYANRSPRSDQPLGSDPVPPTLWSMFGSGQIVSFPDMTVAGAILRRSEHEGKKVILQHARQISARDLRSGNLILLTSPIASPWITLFEDKLNFRYQIDFRAPSHPSAFVNTRPLPGEKPSYSSAATAPDFGVTYGLVARLPNLSGTGKVLLICGLRYTGLEAAGDYATDPQAFAQLARLLKTNDVWSVPDFEVLLETYSIGAAPRDIKVAAYRRISSSTPSANH